MSGFATTLTRCCRSRRTAWSGSSDWGRCSHLRRSRQAPCGRQPSHCSSPSTWRSPRGSTSGSFPSRRWPAGSCSCPRGSGTCCCGEARLRAARGSSARRSRRALAGAAARRRALRVGRDERHRRDPGCRQSSAAPHLAVGNALRINQYWTMFSPNPPVLDVWIERIGTTRSGERFDVARGAAAKPEKPERLSAQESWSWRIWLGYLQGLELDDPVRAPVLDRLAEFRAATGTRAARGGALRVDRDRPGDRTHAPRRDGAADASRGVPQSLRERAIRRGVRDDREPGRIDVHHHILPRLYVEALAKAGHTGGGGMPFPALGSGEHARDDGPAGHRDRRDVDLRARDPLRRRERRRASSRAAATSCRRSSSPITRPASARSRSCRCPT